MSADPDAADPAAQVQPLALASVRYMRECASYKVTTEDDYRAAGGMLTHIKGRLGELAELRLSITRPMDAAKKRVLDLFRTPEANYSAAERGIKLAMAAFTTRQEAARREEQRRLDEAARKRADALRSRAMLAESAGKSGKAAELEAKANTVVAPVLPKATPKVAGVQVREVWKFAIEDEAKLPREYTMPDEQKIRRVVQALKSDARIAGVRVWSENTVAAGATTREE
jgi:hypothetical protein